MSSNVSFADVIARRELDVGGASAKVVVEFAKPVPDGRDFGCSFRISHAGREKIRTIYGVDSVQALMLALKTVAVDLQHGDWLPCEGIYWLEPGNGTGFPDT